MQMAVTVASLGMARLSVAVRPHSYGLAATWLGCSLLHAGLTWQTVRVIREARLRE